MTITSMSRSAKGVLVPGWTRRACLALAAPLLWTLAGCSPTPGMAPVPAGATVLALGDSITHGTGAPPGHDWPRLLAGMTGWHMVNAGIPGDTAQNARGRIGPLLNEHRPALVIIELGGNDLLRRRPAQTVKEDLRDILRQAQAGGAQVLLVAVPAPSLLAAVASRLSDTPLYQELAEEEGVGLVVDVLSAVLSDDALRADQIHPNAAGYRQLAQGLKDRMQSLGLLAR